MKPKLNSWKVKWMCAFGNVYIIRGWAFLQHDTACTCKLFYSNVTVIGSNEILIFHVYTVSNQRLVYYMFLLDLQSAFLYFNSIL